VGEAAMSMFEILALGAIAGFTVFLGLPLGRMRSTSTQVRSLLNAGATGILLFLFWDVLSEGIEPVEAALADALGGGSWLHFGWLAAVFAVSLTVGLMSLVYYDLWLARRARASLRFGPGAANVREFRAGPIARLRPAAFSGSRLINWITLSRFAASHKIIPALPLSILMPVRLGPIFR